MEDTANWPGIDDELDHLNAQEEYWKGRSIYKIQPWITNWNDAAFTPRVVSFGPYHHGREHLEPMQPHKVRAVERFLRRCKTPLKDCMDVLRPMVGELIKSYDALPREWREDTERFLKMMIFDGCFMLEVLRVDAEFLPYYSDMDPIFSWHGKVHAVPSIKEDMVKIENQLPMLLLDKLLEVEGNKTKDDKLSATWIIAESLLSKRTDFLSELGKCFHLLDVYRRSMINVTDSLGRELRRVSDGNSIAPSAAELDEAGVLFQTADSMRDMTFNQGVLRLPVIDVDRTTETILLNLVAFERFHIGAPQELTSFTFFMKTILNTERDVELLVRKEIIKNAYGSNKDVADLFNRVSRYLSFDPNSKLWDLHNMVNEYQRKPWNQWRATLRRVYFGNPWVTISVFGGVSIFVFTLMQTIYTALSYYKKPDTPPKV